MADEGEPRAGGALIAGGTLAGAAAGIALGQATIGVLAGFAAGTLAALLVWVRDRRGR